jgi:hypothetical protein
MPNKDSQGITPDHLLNNGVPNKKNDELDKRVQGDNQIWATEDWHKGYEAAMKDARQVITQNYRSVDSIKEAFDVLDKGHGGGNFRRLIILAKERLDIK